jgi:hypothetical protein
MATEIVFGHWRWRSTQPKVLHPNGEAILKTFHATGGSKNPATCMGFITEWLVRFYPRFMPIFMYEIRLNLQ